MPRRPDALCAGGCGRMLSPGPGSLPPGQRACRECRGAPSEGPVTLPCGTCGKPVTRSARAVAESKSGHLYCDRKCANAKPKGRSAPGGPSRRADGASRRAADRARCARRRGAMAAAIVEVVDPDVVFDRDDWRCQICHKRIDRSLSGRDAMGPTLDHLVPISQGGEHSYANVRAAHRRCNSQRGTGGVVQLALVG